MKIIISKKELLNIELQLVETVNCENAGLILDCFHFHAMGSKLEEL